jgi:hypothetical protein
MAGENIGTGAGGAAHIYWQDRRPIIALQDGSSITQ